MNAVLTTTSDDGLCWFALRTPGQREFAARDVLQRRLGLRHVFVPLEHRWVRASRYDKRREFRAFPRLVGYVFIGLDKPEDLPYVALAKLRNLIIGVVSFEAERPARLPSDAIQWLQKLSGAPSPYAQNPHRSFQTGDRVRFRLGSGERESVIEEVLAAKKAKMLIEMLGAKREVVLPLAELEAA